MPQTPEQLAKIETIIHEQAERLVKLHLRRVFWENEYRRLQKAERIDRALGGILWLLIGIFVPLRWTDDKMETWVNDAMHTDATANIYKTLIDVGNAELLRLKT